MKISFSIVTNLRPHKSRAIPVTAFPAGESPRYISPSSTRQGKSCLKCLLFTFNQSALSKDHESQAELGGNRRVSYLCYQHASNGGGAYQVSGFPFQSLKQGSTPQSIDDEEPSRLLHCPIKPSVPQIQKIPQIQTSAFCTSF